MTLQDTIIGIAIGFVLNILYYHVKRFFTKSDKRDDSVISLEREIKDEVNELRQEINKIDKELREKSSKIERNYLDKFRDVTDTINSVKDDLSKHLTEFRIETIERITSVEKLIERWIKPA